MALVVINVCYFCKTICGQDMIKIAQPGHAGAVSTHLRPGIGQLVPTHALHGTFDHLLKKQRLVMGKGWLG